MVNVYDMAIAIGSYLIDKLSRCQMSMVWFIQSCSVKMKRNLSCHTRLSFDAMLKHSQLCYHVTLS